MRRIFHLVFAAIAFALPAHSQISSYDELEIEEESVTTPYSPAGGNQVMLKSRKGTSGMNKTPEADAIVGKPVKQIVLVFTELNAADEEEREDANRERWDNLIMTYPEFFQENTTYKGVCQCNPSGDVEGFKKAQGFYVYYQGAPAAKPAAAPTEAAPDKTAAKTETPVQAKAAPPAEEKKPVAKEPEPVKETVREPEPVKETVKEPEPPVSEPVAERPAETGKTETETEAAEPVAEAPVKKKKPASSKPRRARDPKACRPACYQGGDEDLHAYFRERIQLSKKQRRKAKNAVVNVRMQIHFDGSIKKTTVSGNNEVINKMVEEAVSGMDKWNPSVKNGITIKSDVRMTLKYDKETKAMKPTDVLTNPKSSPKCRCMSDSELFD